jgi:hypothetical protein
VAAPLIPGLRTPVGGGADSQFATGPQRPEPAPVPAPPRVDGRAAYNATHGTDTTIYPAQTTTATTTKTPTMSFLDTLTGTANDLADVYKNIKGTQTPTPAKPVPVAPVKSNTTTYLLIGGGALVLILVLVFALKK